MTKLVCTDNNLFIKSTHGSRRFYKIDKGIITHGTQLLFESQFKGDISVSVVELEIDECIANIEPGELTLLNKNHFLFIENKDSIFRIEQDGDTPELDCGIVEISATGVEVIIGA